MHKVYLSLGTNLGNRMNILLQSFKLINKRIGNVIKSSSIYETEPWGFNSDNQFLNQVLLIHTNKLPDEVLKIIQTIETELGRSRNSIIYESRKIDIDILFYDDLIIEENYLQIPHPYLHVRNFTLIPLIEISPEFIHPVFRLNLMNLSLLCKDNCQINIYNNMKDSKSFYIHEI